MDEFARVLDVNVSSLFGLCQVAGPRCSLAAPGPSSKFFPTEMNTELFESEAAMKWLRRTCPTGRAGALAELDAALLFLCAPTSTYCTGQVVAVDGGWTAV